ncbi:MAG: acyltransferase [Formivibrio sp.]|nr:acyltransferase [Formivibrio sp.]
MTQILTAEDSHSPLPRSDVRDIHFPELDGIRGIAILLVLLSHVGGTLRSPIYNVFNTISGQGWIGVDLFFVLSGFLITRILLTTNNSTNYYKRFYIRRGLRIWPLYYLAVLLAFTALAVASHLSFYHSLTAAKSQFAGDPVADWHNLPMYLLYLQNFWLGDVGGFSVLAVTWTLCIEEQYYLVWPLCVRNFSIHALLRFAVGFALISSLLRLSIHFIYPDNFDLFHWITYHFTPLHLDAILLGSALAICFYLKRQFLENMALLYTALGVGGAVSLICVCYMGNPYAESLIYFALSVTFAAIVALALQGWGRRLFRNPPLRYIGKISYSLYLLHPPIFNALSSHSVMAKLGFSHNIAATEFAFATLSFALSIGVAAFSWHFFESRILALKTRFAA